MNAKVSSLKDPLAAIYCRLSKEDLDKDHDKSESESIKNQKIMLEAYALQQGWGIHDFYIDEDYSGSDRDRPEFSRMITDAMLGRFHIVLCKKQARFARDIEYIEKYVHGLFAERGIRFVAVLDNIDTGSWNRSVKKASQINSLVDEWYLSDLSENIIAALNTKRKNAEFIGSWAPFGYEKDPQNKNALRIDPAAAAVVSEIFHLYLSGSGVNRIAQSLNQKGIPNPLTYKQQNQERINPNPAKATIKRRLWTPSTISSILHNQVYMGDMVQGKYRKVSYKSKKLIRVPRSDWIIVPGSHPPIIESDVWHRVQKKLSSGSRAASHKPQHILAGKVYCGECGAKLVRSGGRSGTKKVSYFCCSARNLSPDCCIGARIEGSALESLILREINGLSEQYFDREALSLRLSASEHRLFSEEEAAKHRLAGLVEYRKGIIKKTDLLYADRLEGIIDQERYLLFNKQLASALSAVDAEEQALRAVLAKTHGAVLSQEQEFQRFLERFRTATVLTRQAAEVFLEEVRIGKRSRGLPQKVEIYWKL